MPIRNANKILLICCVSPNNDCRVYYVANLPNGVNPNSIQDEWLSESTCECGSKLELLVSLYDEDWRHSAKLLKLRKEEE